MSTAEMDQDPAPFLVPSNEAGVENLALIHALRANADAMKRLGAQQDRMSGKIDTMHNVVHDIDKRLAVIEGNSLASKVEEIEKEVDKLKEAEQRRQGAIGLGEWFAKSWPSLIAFLALVVYVILNEGGRI